MNDRRRVTAISGLIVAAVIAMACAPEPKQVKVGITGPTHVAVCDTAEYSAVLLEGTPGGGEYYWYIGTGAGLGSLSPNDAATTTFTSNGASGTMCPHVRYTLHDHPDYPPPNNEGGASFIGQVVRISGLSVWPGEFVESTETYVVGVGAPGSYVSLHATLKIGTHVIEDPNVLPPGFVSWEGPGEAGETVLDWKLPRDVAHDTQTVTVKIGTGSCDGSRKSADIKIVEVNSLEVDCAVPVPDTSDFATAQFAPNYPEIKANLYPDCTDEEARVVLDWENATPYAYDWTLAWRSTVTRGSFVVKAEAGVSEKDVDIHVFWLELDPNSGLAEPWQKNIALNAVAPYNGADVGIKNMIPDLDGLSIIVRSETPETVSGGGTITTQDGQTRVSGVAKGAYRLRPYIDVPCNGEIQCGSDATGTVFDFVLEKTALSAPGAHPETGMVTAGDYYITIDLPPESARPYANQQHAAQVRTRRYAYWKTDPENCYGSYLKSVIRGHTVFEDQGEGDPNDFQPPIWGLMIYNNALLRTGDLGFGLSYSIISVSLPELSGEQDFVAFKGHVEGKGPNDEQWTISPTAQTNLKTSDLGVSDVYGGRMIGTPAFAPLMVNHYRVGDSGSRAEFWVRLEISGGFNDNWWLPHGHGLWVKVRLKPGHELLIDYVGDLIPTTQPAP